jgi:hypothetical protein
VFVTVITFPERSMTGFASRGGRDAWSDRKFIKSPIVSRDVGAAGAETEGRVISEKAISLFLGLTG